MLIQAFGHNYVRVATITAVCALAAGLANAQETTLRLHHYLPPSSMAHNRFHVPWTEKVAKDSGGRIKFQIYPAMQLGGTAPQLFDQARDGVVDITWTVLGYTAARFPSTEVFELPFMTRTAEGSSRALWEYAARNKLFESELKEVKVLALHVHDQGQLHTTSKQVKTLADFRGLKVRAGTRINNKMLAIFGATPVGMPLPQTLESLSKGVIDGTLFPWEVVPAVKVHELVKYHTETGSKSRSMYTTTFVLAMNRASYEKLPAPLKHALDSNSGADTSAWIGARWDGSAAPARKLAAERGNTVYTLPPEEVARWEKAAVPLVEEWVRDMNGKGLKGRELLTSARELIKQHDPD